MTFRHNLPMSNGDEAIPEVLSDTLQVELSVFLCQSIFLCDPEALQIRYWTELSGDGRRLVRSLNKRLTEMLATAEREQ